ncbi:hypothetical protein N7456_011254 [Penicillium angulare]|uniref:Uncharacterized protein n=1 Tax=Penicillium angulare TaxID=116970 RepID=A0A9W9ETF0_9EURO|nr:hypothetical protein N7456_011254 [Penicillium angulare]
MEEGPINPAEAPISCSTSRGSSWELAYASPVRGSGDRKRRFRGCSDDKGLMTRDGFHREDLRVGGPYLCSVPTRTILISRGHPNFGIMDRQTIEGVEFSEAIKEILMKWGTDFHNFDIVGRQSIFNPENKPILTLLIYDNGGNARGCWLSCTRDLRKLLFARKLDHISVEIAHNWAFTCPETWPVLREDEVFKKWDTILAILLKRLNLDGLRMISCLRRGRSSRLQDCIPTVVIIVMPGLQLHWKSMREIVVRILDEHDLGTVAVEITRDVIESRGLENESKRGVSAKILLNSARRMTHPGQSIASSMELEISGTLTGFLQLLSAHSNERQTWHTVALTCFNAIVPPSEQVPEKDKAALAEWQSKGISGTTAKGLHSKLLRVDHPAKVSKAEEASKIKELLWKAKAHPLYEVGREMEREGTLATLTETSRKAYCNTNRQVSKCESNLMALEQVFSGNEFLGTVVLASGLKLKDIYTLKGEKYPTKLEWALISPNEHAESPDYRKVSNEILQDCFVDTEADAAQLADLHMELVIIYGSRSGMSLGMVNTLKTANIEARLQEGQVQTVVTIENTIVGASNGHDTSVSFPPFWVHGDSGAIIVAYRTSAVVGMLFSGMRYNSISYFTRVDDLFADIKEVSGAKDVRFFAKRRQRKESN